MPNSNKLRIVRFYGGHLHMEEHRVYERDLTPTWTWFVREPMDNKVSLYAPEISVMEPCFQTRREVYRLEYVASQGITEAHNLLHRDLPYYILEGYTLTAPDLGSLYTNLWWDSEWDFEPDHGRWYWGLSKYQRSVAQLERRTGQRRDRYGNKTPLKVKQFPLAPGYPESFGKSFDNLSS